METPSPQYEWVAYEPHTLGLRMGDWALEGPQQGRQTCENVRLDARRLPTSWGTAEPGLEPFPRWASWCVLCILAGQHVREKQACPQKTRTSFHHSRTARVSPIHT